MYEPISLPLNKYVQDMLGLTKKLRYQANLLINENTVKFSYQVYFSCDDGPFKTIDKIKKLLKETMNLTTRDITHNGPYTLEYSLNKSKYLKIVALLKMAGY